MVGQCCGHVAISVSFLSNSGNVPERLCITSGLHSLLHFEVGACIHGRRPHILPVCCNGVTLAWIQSVFSLRFQLLTASVFHAFSGFSFVKCNFAGSAFFFVSVTALFSVNCSSGRKFLQVFRLHSGQNFMKHPAIDPVLEAYGQVFYALFSEHCAQALVSCPSCAQLLLPVISK